MNSKEQVIDLSGMTAFCINQAVWLTLQVSGEANSYAYLTQRLSVAVQQGNAASMLGTMKVDSEDGGGQ